MAVETLGGTITLPFLVLVFRGGDISSEVAVVRLSITRDVTADMREGDCVMEAAEMEGGAGGRAAAMANIFRRRPACSGDTVAAVVRACPIIIRTDCSVDCGASAPSFAVDG